MSSEHVVFLFDVDNTLIDNDRIVADMMRNLERDIGHEHQQRYWDYFEQLRTELGYADYLGALQRYRVNHPRDFKQKNDMFCAHRPEHPPPTIIAIVGPQAKRISRPPTAGRTNPRNDLFESRINPGRHARAQGVRGCGHLSSDSRKTRLIRAVSSPELKGLVM